MKSRIEWAARQGYEALRRVEIEERHVRPISAYASTLAKPLDRKLPTEKLGIPVVELKFTYEPNNSKWQSLVVARRKEGSGRRDRRNLPLKLVGLPPMLAALTSTVMTKGDSKPDTDTPEQKHIEFNEYIERLKSNDQDLLNLDLSSFVLSKDQLSKLRDAIADNHILGHITWGWMSIDFETIIKEIEDKIIENNRRASLRPSDYVLALLSNHSYFDSKPGDKPFEGDTAHVEWAKALSGWEVREVFKGKDTPYRAVLYVNREKRQMVLAHKGTSYLDDWGTNFDSILHKIVSNHQGDAFVATKRSSEEAKKEGYSLSITGHSLGGWLAELSAYYCEYDPDIDHKGVRTVTFDSPGSRATMLEVYDRGMNKRRTKVNPDRLDIVTYLARPNAVNMCNEHVGKYYQVDVEAGVLPTIVAGTSLGKVVNALFTHKLDRMIEIFDPETGYPKVGKYHEIIRWPVLIRNPDARAVVDEKRQLAQTFAQYLYTYMARQYPAASITIEAARRLLPLLTKGTTIDKAQKVLKEIIDGKIDIESVTGICIYLDPDLRVKDELTERQVFDLKYKAGLQKSKSLPNRAVDDLFHGDASVDHAMQRLWKVQEAIKSAPLTDINTRLTLIQLLDIISRIRDIETHTGSKSRIVAIRKVVDRIEVGDVDHIRASMQRLWLVNPKRIDELIAAHERAHPIPKIVIAPNIPSIQDKFIGRAIELQRLHENTHNRVMVISAHGGTGKSALAREYGLRASRSGKAVVRWIPENGIEQAFLDMATELKIETEGVKPDVLKRKVYAELSKLGKEVLLIFDNVDSKGYAEQVNKYLDGMPPNTRALITTRDSDHKKKFPGCVSITVNPFNEKEAKQFLEENEVPGSEEDLLSLVRTVGNKEDGSTQYSVLPHKLSLVAGAFTSDATMTVERYKTQYELMKKDVKSHPEFEIVLGRIFGWTDWWYGYPTWKMLQYCAYLNPDFIPVEVFEQIGFAPKDINEAISQLKSLGLVHEVVENDKKGLKLHRLTTDYTREYSNTHVKEPVDSHYISILARGIAGKLFNRNNLTTQGLKRNRLYFFHVEKLLTHARDYDIDPTPTPVYLNICRGVYHDYSGEHVKANQIFEDQKRILESMLGIRDDLPLEEIIKRLSEKDKNYPTLYAQALYYTGRTYLCLKEQLLTDKDYNKLSKDNLDRAVKVRDIIDRDKEARVVLFNDSFNEGTPRLIDSIAFRRNGILLWCSLQDSVDELKAAEAGYRGLIANEGTYSEKERDKLNLVICKRSLMDVLIRLIPRCDKGEKEHYLNEILDQACKYIGIESADLGNIAIVREKLDKIGTDTRRARDYNLFGKIFLLKGGESDLRAAEEFFKRVKEIEGSNENFIVGDAYYGLACVYEKQGRLEEAKAAIKNCIDLRLRIKALFIEEAKKLEERVNKAIEREKGRDAVNAERSCIIKLRDVLQGGWREYISERKEEDAARGK